MAGLGRVVLPPGAIVGRHVSTDVVRVFGVTARSAEVTNCLPWTRKMELRWTDPRGRLQVNRFTLPAHAEVTVNKLSPDTAYSLVVMMPSVGGSSRPGDETEQARVQFRTKPEVPAGRKPELFAPYPTKSEAETAFVALVDASGKRYQLEVVASQSRGGGVVRVHEIPGLFHFGQDPKGEPYAFPLVMRNMPGENVRKGDRLKVTVYDYGQNHPFKEMIYYATIVEIAGRPVRIRDPLLGRR